MAARTTIGFLYPGSAAEQDYPLIEGLLGPEVALAVVHTSVGEDAHRVDALLDLGRAERLAEGAERLHRLGVDAAVWACTSGSFVFGWDGARQQVAALGQALGVPASSTSFAFVHAARALGIATVAVAATYPEEVTGHFVEFLRHGGIQVLGRSSRGIVTAAQAGTLGGEEVLELAVAADHPDADAVLVPDTALRTAAWLAELEERLAKPVLTANQVSVWEGLRLVGGIEPHPGLGRLFRDGFRRAGGRSGG